MDTTVIKWLIGIFVTTLVGLNALWLRVMDKKYDGPKLRKLNAEADSLEIQNMQAIVDEIKLERAELKSAVGELTRRVNLLEERERHQLVRSAVHESWDRIAYRLLLLHYPDHEPPPSLHEAKELEQAEREHIERLDADSDQSQG